MRYKTLLMFIRSAMLLPRGKPSPVWLDAIHKALRDYEIKKYARCGAKRTGKRNMRYTNHE